MQAKFKKRLLKHYPHLKGLRLAYLGEGWDNLAGLLDEEWVFLFPKRPEVERKLQIMQKLLKELAPVLPVAVPDIVYSSNRPGAAFAGYRRLPGYALAETPMPASTGSWWQAQAGNFLTCLHAFPIDTARQAGIRGLEWGRPALQTSPETWQAALFNFFQLLQAELRPLLASEIWLIQAERFESFLQNQANFDFEPVLLHGDFSTDHILVDPAARRVTGIIDWGDCAIGDPAYDLNDELLPYYSGPVDAGFVRRMRFYKLLEPLICMHFGFQHNDIALLDYGRYLLEE